MRTAWASIGIRPLLAQQLLRERFTPPIRLYSIFLRLKKPLNYVCKYGGQKRAWDPLELHQAVLSYLIWVPGIRLKDSARPRVIIIDPSSLQTRTRS